jgi:anti-sigma regulatory factor (Ser/Thr protein kinase)
MGPGLSLTIPGERRFLGVARLLVGGLAARLDLPYEQMDDLQLAAESALASEPPGNEVTLELEVGEDGIELRIGPFDRRSLNEDDRKGELGLDRLLSALVDRVDVVQQDGSDWLVLEKRVALPGDGD